MPKPLNDPELVSGQGRHDWEGRETLTTSSFMKRGYVYIMSNYKRTTFYIGVTNSLERRVLEHKQGLTPGFTQRYKLKHLVYYEVAPSMWEAIAREKQLKNWHRDWKINLIKSVNPEMKDLSAEVLGQEALDAETGSA
jgi:putative endonuclease